MNAVKPTPEYLTFAEADWLDARKRTRVWTVASKAHGYVLGQVEWSTGWRRYVYKAFDDTYWSPGCLVAVAEFCQKQTDAHDTALLKAKRLLYKEHEFTLVFEDGDGDLARCSCGEQGYDFSQGEEWWAKHTAEVKAAWQRAA